MERLFRTAPCGNDPVCFTFPSIPSLPSVSQRRPLTRERFLKGGERLNRVDGGQRGETKRQTNSERFTRGRGSKWTSEKRTQSWRKAAEQRVARDIAQNKKK